MTVPAMRPGVRLRSAVCDVEVIVVRAGAPELGKRYVDADGSVELLCTKPGPSSLSVGEQLMTLKEAKPLPASD